MQRYGSAAGSAVARRPKLATSVIFGAVASATACLCIDTARALNNASVSGDWGAFSGSWTAPRVLVDWTEEAAEPAAHTVAAQQTTIGKMERQIASLEGEVQLLNAQLQRLLQEEKQEEK